MSMFEFRTDNESETYCLDIVREMNRLFAISENEAIGRMNRAWKGIEFIGSDDLIYHEDEKYWANTIYYGKDSYWWMNPPNLEPLPWP